MGLLCMQHELKPIYFLKTVIKIIVYSLLDTMYTIRLNLIQADSQGSILSGSY